MKKILSALCLLVMLLCLFSFVGCDMLSGIFDNLGGDTTGNYNDELVSATGKWILLNDDDTYFTFDGSKGAMTFTYTQDGVQKYSGTFRVVHRGVGKDVTTPLTFVITRSDKTKEDWVGCYAENFDTDFTQFTIMTQEEDLGMIDGSIHTHIYRISQLPYAMGTYVLQGKNYKAESDDYRYANEKVIPSGTYTLEGGQTFTFLTIKPQARELFRYVNGDVVVEGVYTLASDGKTIYLYIANDPYNKVTNADKEKYDTTFGIYYPPDIYLRGDFTQSGGFEINDLYHHSSSPITVPDSAWVFGNYTKN